MTMRVLDVWWDGRIVGQLTQNQHGELGFAYSPEWLGNDDAPPLSVSLPMRAEPFSRRECRPFFGGLLPEESQRDAATQALGVPTETKYASEGGPTFGDCFALLRRVAARPAVDVLKMLDAVIFNLIVGNADAHGKNFSILYDRDGPRLAPLYDLLATVAYPELSPKLAMRIGKRETLGEMDAKGWSAFAVDAGVGLPLIRRRVSEISQAVMASVHDVAGEVMRAGLDESALSRFAAMAADRAAQCAITVQRTQE